MATFKNLVEGAISGSDSEAPPLYLSTAGGKWQVIANATPVGRPDSRERAEEMYQRMRKPGRDAGRPAVWDGDKGDWVWHR